MESYIEEIKNRELPENIGESLVKVFEVTALHESWLMSGNFDCGFIQVILPRDLENAGYALVHPFTLYEYDNTYDLAHNFSSATKLRLPKKDEGGIIEGVGYVPQDISVILDYSRRNEAQEVIKNMENLFSKISKDEILEDRKIKIAGRIHDRAPSYTLNFPVVYGSGQLAAEFENILSGFLNEIRNKGSEKFYKGYKRISVASLEDLTEGAQGIFRRKIEEYLKESV